MNRARLICGDVRSVLPTLPSESVQCVVTSPPYWGLRDYGCEGQLGLERTPEEYVANMVAVFREVRRVLRDDGVVWLNLGDSYADGGNGGGGKFMRMRAEGAWAPRADKKGWRAPPPGLKHKDLVGAPWRVALAMQADGWFLRDCVIWHKPNAMPSSASDRTTGSHEYVFLLSRLATYFYDQDAVREPHTDPRPSKNGRGGKNAMRGQAEIRPRGNLSAEDRYYNPLGRNRRSVWTIALEPFDGAHFAVMPEALVEPCIMAGSREGDTVMDPFAGSGTVGVVALKRGRQFVGVELNPKYAQLAQQRIEGDAPLLNRAEVGT